MDRRLIPHDLVKLDWEKLRDMLDKMDPKEDAWYMITVNKGQPDEYRTKFMTYQDAKDLIGFALEKKRLRVPVTL
jgi:hypothetical protein